MSDAHTAAIQVRSILAEDSRIINRPWALAQHNLSPFPPFLKLVRDMKAPELNP